MLAVTAALSGLVVSPLAASPMLARQPAVQMAAMNTNERIEEMIKDNKCAHAHQHSHSTGAV